MTQRRPSIRSTGAGCVAYVGTLANDGVAIAPFHDLDSAVSAETKSELDALKADIISGKLVVESKASPKK